MFSVNRDKFKFPRREAGNVYTPRLNYGKLIIVSDETKGKIGFLFYLNKAKNTEGNKNEIEKKNNFL